jgi:hypothetical protein
VRLVGYRGITDDLDALVEEAARALVRLSKRWGWSDLPELDPVGTLTIYAHIGRRVLSAPELASDGGYVHDQMPNIEDARWRSSGTTANSRGRKDKCPTPTSLIGCPVACPVSVRPRPFSGPPTYRNGSTEGREEWS